MDIPALRQLIDTQLIAAIKTLEEYEILRGDGTTGHLSGILPAATAVTADAADTPIDFIARLIGSLAATGIVATGVVLHPSDWLSMTLTKSVNEEYLLGSPTQAPTQALWSVGLALSTQMVAGTALVGDFTRGASLIFREQATVEVSSEHADYFVRNLLAVRAEERVQLIVNQGAYFAKGTIPTGGAAMRPAPEQKNAPRR
jgi:HK97 family phage major capsid protein